MSDGNKALVDLSTFIVDAVKGVEGAVKNGSSWALDLPAFIKLVSDAQVLIGEDGNVIPDIKALDSASAVALTGTLVAGLGIADAKAVSVINASLAFLTAGIALEKAIVAPDAPKAA